MPFDYGLRPHNRQRLANARAKPIEANKNQSVDGVEGLFLRSGSPQNVYLLPQHPNFRLERCPRPKQICDHPNNEPDKISHPATASPDSRSTASQIEFAIGTGLAPPSRGALRETPSLRLHLHIGLGDDFLPVRYLVANQPAEFLRRAACRLGAYLRQRFLDR